MKDTPPRPVALVIAELREALAAIRLQLAVRAFNPNQPRWPAGRSDGGQWRPAEGTTLVAGKLDQRREAACSEQYDRDSDPSNVRRLALLGNGSG